MVLPRSLLLPAILFASSSPPRIDAFSTTRRNALPANPHRHRQRTSRAISNPHYPLNFHHDAITTTTRSTSSSPSNNNHNNIIICHHHPHEHSNDEHENDEPPPSPKYIEVSPEVRTRLKSEFTSLLHAMLDNNNSTDPLAEEDYPSLFTQNIDMILNVISVEGLLEEVIQEDVINYSNNNKNDNGNGNGGDDSSSVAATRLDQLSEAVSLILPFIETFVDQTKSTDDTYKNLLRQIFASIAPGGNPEDTSSGGTASSAMEKELDLLLSMEKEAFTPGFLRHVEGECERLSSVAGAESAKMLQILRIIQARVLEELGKGIGEGAIVLGQLLGYDDEAERLAVLDAGLAVRGAEFAREMKGLTEEALEGFKNVQTTKEGVGGVDPELVRSVEVIDGRIRRFVEKMGIDMDNFQ